MVAKLEKNRTILDEKQLEFILQRLAHQLIETHTDFSNTILIGVQPRGLELCNRIHTIISTKLKKTILKGSLDISMHRDDIHLHGTSLQMGITDIPCSLDEINIVLIDDVLYTGRTIRAALDTLMDYGRPRDIELLVLIDRRLHRHVPIQAKYIGKTIDSIQREKVKVVLGNDNKEKDKVILVNNE
jgi:pyrimidine operon attenuation protein / uracil phosphoribosyltransferase